MKTRTSALHGVWLLVILLAAPSFAAQSWRGKKVYFGDAHWHSCFSQDQDPKWSSEDEDPLWSSKDEEERGKTGKTGKTPTEQYYSMLNDYGLDFSLQSEHAEAAQAGVPECDKYLPMRIGGVVPYFDDEIATAIKLAADDWNGRVYDGSDPKYEGTKFVTFPGYEWANDPRCWHNEPEFLGGVDRNHDDNTPGHINYFFSDTTGWSYGPDVWEPGDGDSDSCAAATALGQTYYSGSRDWMDEILGQLIHQRDDPDRDYDLLIQYNHPAATIDRGGGTDHLAKWYELEHSDEYCSVAPGGPQCRESQCEAPRRAYGVTSVEWYASQEAAIGSTLFHSGPQCADDPEGLSCVVSRIDHETYHLAENFVASRGLREGFNLAAFGGSDSHGDKKTNPSDFPGSSRGAGSDSLTAVYAGDATRPAIWDGLSHKRTYTLSRFRDIGPVHKGRVDFFSPVAGGVIGGVERASAAFQIPGDLPTPEEREVGMGEYVEVVPEGQPYSFTISAAAEEGTSGVYPKELRLYRVGVNTPLTTRTDLSNYWLDDLPGDPGKLGELVGKVENAGSNGAEPPPTFTHTFKGLTVYPGDAVFAVVVYSDSVWIDDYYDWTGQPLKDANGDGVYDIAPARHCNEGHYREADQGPCDNSTWARTTPIFVYSRNEIARQTAFCSEVSFAGSPFAAESAAGGGDAGQTADEGVLPVAADAAVYDLEWNQWMVSVPADYQFVDLTFRTQKDEDDIGHLFAVRIDGQLVYSGRAGINHPADTLVEQKNISFPVRKGLHRIEVHMDDQEYTESEDNYHCNDYEGPPGYVDAIVFHNESGDACDDVTPPEITCPDDVTAECSAVGGVPASHPTIEAFLAAAAATDDADASPEITNDAPAFFPNGTTQVTFTATDASGNAASCTAAVMVGDTSPPEITSPLELAPAVLSPSNHKLVTIAVSTIVAEDVCDPEPSILCGVESDEPASLPGAGDTPIDIVFDGVSILTQGTGEREIVSSAGSGTFSLELRAERAGRGDGRVYTATCVAVDSTGARSDPQSAEVFVSH